VHRLKIDGPSILFDVGHWERVDSQNGLNIITNRSFKRDGGLMPLTCTVGQDEEGGSSNESQFKI
jgi:hypothetical protein